jgi:hypothetical protein
MPVSLCAGMNGLVRVELDQDSVEENALVRRTEVVGDIAALGVRVVLGGLW